MPEFNVLPEHLWSNSDHFNREETAQMQVPISDPCEKTGLSAMFIMAKDQINEECLLRNGESWESLSLADTSNLVARRVLVADASVWRPILVEVPLCGKNEHIMLLWHDFTTEVWHCPEFQILSFRSSRGISATSGWMGVAGLKSLGVASSSQAANDDTSWMKSKKPVACERYFSDQVRVTTVREPCSSQFLLLPRVKSMLKAQKAWAWQTSSHLVLGRLFGCFCCLTAFRNPCVTRNHVACSSSEQEWAEHQTTFAMLEEQKLALVQYLASLANWCGLRAAIQFISITSTEERADMQVSASDHCERTILFPVSIFAKGQINEECLRLQCWKLRKLELGSHLRPCVWKTFSFWCYCVTGFQESYCYQLPGITLPFPVREWAEHRTTLAMLGEQTLALNQCLASLANWWGIRAAIQFTSITSTKHRAHAHVQVSAPLQKVRSMKSVSPAMWRAEKAWAWQTPQTLCWEEL